MKVKARFLNPETKKKVTKLVSGPFELRESAERFVEMYKAEHPDHEVWIEESQAA